MKYYAVVKMPEAMKVGVNAMVGMYETREEAQEVARRVQELKGNGVPHAYQVCEFHTFESEEQQLNLYLKHKLVKPVTLQEMLSPPVW